MNLDKLSSHRFWGSLFELIQSHPHRKEMIATHAAMIVRGGSILAKGINSPGTNGFVRYYSPEWFGTHAEVTAILEARRKSDLRGTKMYVARLRKDNGDLGLSKPCEYCLDAIYRYGIKSVYYTTETGFAVLRRGDISLAVAA